MIIKCKKCKELNDTINKEIKKIPALIAPLKKLDKIAYYQGRQDMLLELQDLIEVLWED